MRPLCVSFFFFWHFLFFALGGPGRSCWPSESGPRRVRFGWLLKQRLKREGEPAFHRGTHTSPNSDAPRGECGFHGRYRFVGNLNPSVLPSTFYPLRFTRRVVFYFLLSYLVFLLFCSLFCLLRTVVVPVHRFRNIPSASLLVFWCSLFLARSFPRPLPGAL